MVLSLAFAGTHLKPFDSSYYFQSKKEVEFYVGSGFWGLLILVDLGEFSRGFLVLDCELSFGLRKGFD